VSAAQSAGKTASEMVGSNKKHTIDVAVIASEGTNNIQKNKVTWSGPGGGTCDARS
jgi:hypothetical protein